MVLYMSVPLSTTFIPKVTMMMNYDAADSDGGSNGDDLIIVRTTFPCNLAHCHETR